MGKAPWQNTRLVKRDPASELRKMKEEPVDGLCIMGCGIIVSQLASTGLIDEYQFVVIPVVLGGGRTVFDGVKEKLRMRLAGSRTFGNGKVFVLQAAGVTPRVEPGRVDGKSAVRGECGVLFRARGGASFAKPRAEPRLHMHAHS